MKCARREIRAFLLEKDLTVIGIKIDGWSDLEGATEVWGSVTISDGDNSIYLSEKEFNSFVSNLELYRAKMESLIAEVNEELSRQEGDLVESVPVED